MVTKSKCQKTNDKLRKIFVISITEKKIDIRKNKEPLKTGKKRQTMEMNKYCPKKETQINSF